MKKVFKVLSVTLMLTLILNLTIISVTAKNAIKDQRKDEKKQEQLVEKYDLLLVSEKDIPEGVVPLKFDSFEEMDNYFSKLESMNNVIEIEPKNITQSLLENHDIGIRSAIFDYGSGTQKATQSLVFSKMNLKIKYDWFMEDGIYTYTKIKSSSACLRYRGH